MKIPFWGCPGLNFNTNLPFDEMRPVYAAFEKEIPMALQYTFGFFKALNYYVYFNLVTLGYLNGLGAGFVF